MRHALTHRCNNVGLKVCFVVTTEWRPWTSVFSRLQKHSKGNILKDEKIVLLLKWNGKYLKDFLLTILPKQPHTHSIEALRPVVILGFQYPPPFLQAFGHCMQTTYSNYLQILFILISPPFPLSSSFPHSFHFGSHCLVWQTVVVHPLSMSVSS